MLVLARRWDERIMIGDDIVITVISLNSEKVRLGISAPRGIRVDREEVYHRIKAGQERPPAGRDDR